MGLTNLGLGIDMVVKGNAKEGFASIGAEFGKFTNMLPGGLGGLAKLGAGLGVAGLAAMAGKKAFDLLSASVAEGLELVDQLEFQTAKLAVRMGPEGQANIGKTTRMIRDMAVQFGLSTEDLSNATGQALAAGIAIEKMPEIMQIAGKMAVGGSMNTATAMDNLSSVMNIYGRDAGTAQAASDSLFRAMQLGRVDIGTMTKEVGGMLPIAARLGVSFNEVTGMVAGLTRAGMSSGQAVSGIQAMMVAVLKGNPETKKMFETYGVDASRAKIATMGWVKWVQYMNEKVRAGGGNIGRMMRSTEGLNAILAMTGKNAASMNEVMDAMGKSAGSTEFAFGKMAGTDVVFEKRIEEARKEMLTELGGIADPLENVWNQIKLTFFTTFTGIIVWFRTNFIARYVEILKPFFTIIGGYLKLLAWGWTKFFQGMGWVAVKIFNLMTWPVKKISEGVQIVIDWAKTAWDWLTKLAVDLIPKIAGPIAFVWKWLRLIGEEIRYRWEQASTFASMAPAMLTAEGRATHKTAQEDVTKIHEMQVRLIDAQSKKQEENLRNGILSGLRDHDRQKPGPQEVVVANGESNPVVTKAVEKTEDYLHDIFFRNFAYRELTAW